jgi:tripartite-type tricarboxylate transporter receptor subunit TctC
MTALRFVIAASATCLLGPLPVFAESPADFYRNKTVYLMIGEGAGGDYDSWGRAVARHIKDHIPGNPTVVPQNAVGAGGMVLANQMYNTLPKDGTVFGIFNRGLPFAPLLGDPGAQFDAAKMSWIGSPETDTVVCTARKDAPVQTMQELFDKELIVGASGPGSDTLNFPLFLTNLLGMKMRIIKGFSGTTEINLAVERNEVQGVCNSYVSASRQALFRSGIVHILFQGAVTPDPRIPDVPTAFALAKTDSDRDVMRLYLSRLEVGRPFVAPPGLPADRLAALRRAFDETMTDPGLIADAKTEKLNLNPRTGQELADIVKSVYGTPQQVVDRTMQAMGH